ncbi:MAG: excinuclease ABC subunit UvrA [Phycisphaerae bacterium]|nr:excinuclease ABC subunit UvrA [Phycisphaerae bacterium]NUQ44405.1 excinuclease ABC subunit UvrA [Phycisphaerae bacterium]
MTDPAELQSDRPAIRIRGARQHNLQNVDVDIPRDSLTVITGLSGSGKSSLAFDTLYAEGRRKYVESLSVHARQFLEQIARPDVERIDGLPPTIAIGQQTGAVGPRSTVATATEIHDFLRLLFARVGSPHCPRCDRAIFRRTPTQIVDAVAALPSGVRAMILAPLVCGEITHADELWARILKQGFVRVRIDGEVHEARNPPTLTRGRAHAVDVIVDRLVIKPDLRTRLTESVETALRIGAGRVLVSHETSPAVWLDEPFSDRHACFDCDVTLAELEPRLFSFNAPHGACPDCSGLGVLHEFDADLVIPDPSRPLTDAVAPWTRGGRGLSKGHAKLLDAFCVRFGVAPTTAFEALPQRVRRILLHGTSPDDQRHFGHAFEGVVPNLQRRFREADNPLVRRRLRAFMAERRCPTCRGDRLRPEALAVRINGNNIAAVCRKNIAAAADLVGKLSFTGEAAMIAAPILIELRERLRFLNEVGLHYLTLDRPTATLSGGELQRIRLATQIGSGLVGVCYVLDEPTIGLHARDTGRLIDSLRRLRQAGNTVVVVEHDADMIRAADWLIEIGPGAGAHGGRIVAAGPRDVVLRSEQSITARYVNDSASPPHARTPRHATRGNMLRVEAARANNLKSLSVTIPLGVFCCVTGVSGSGKSTLVHDVLLRALRRRLRLGGPPPAPHDRLVGGDAIQRIVEVSQSPIGRAGRGNAATFTGVFDSIRSLFAKTREARLRGYGESRFSFNVKGGRCEACRGHGTRRIEMHFLPDVSVPCLECGGARFSRETIEIKYRGRSIADVLEMKVEEALAFFESFNTIRSLLSALSDVGLGYLTLGQSSATLSGGEAQRVRLASALGKPPPGRTLFVLDEPTTGLHFADIDRLLSVLHRLVEVGHSVLVIEHNLAVIRQADWIIDLGPEGGDAGGRLVAEGPPEAIAACAASHTGRYLRRD